MSEMQTAAAPDLALAGKTGFAGLSNAQVKAYRAEGFVFPFAAMSEAGALQFVNRIEEFERAYGERAAQVLRQKSHIVLTLVDELIRLEPVLDAVEALLGPDILCWSTSFFIKNPGDGKFISWHQDAPYWGLEADDIVTAWIALTASHAGNGCMRVIPGSHQTLLPHHDRPRAGNMLTRGQEVAATINEAEAVSIELAAGQFSLHHERMVHGSQPNTGDTRRIGLAVRYIRPTARQVVDPSDTAAIVRGTDRHHHFAPEPRPVVDMAPANLDFMERILAMRAGGVFRRKPG